MSKGDSYCVKLNFFWYQLEAAKNNYISRYFTAA